MKVDGKIIQTIDITVPTLSTEQQEQQKQDQLVTGQQATTDAINNQTEAINKQTNSIDNQTDQILSEDTDEITSDDLGVSMPTVEGAPDLSNVFNIIYSAFTETYEGDSYDIVFGIPGHENAFTFSIPSNLLTSKLPDTINVLISVFWWVVFGGMVLKSVTRIIHQVVTFNDGSAEGGDGFLEDLTKSPTEYVLFNILK